MLTIGHRGLKNEYPENTVAAVRKAARIVDIVEIDVRPCGSGELVAAHDDELERITGHEGNVSETDLDTLRTKSVQSSTEAIPTFEELLDSWPRNTGLNVDVKESTCIGDVLTLVSTVEIDGPIILSAEASVLETLNLELVDEMVGLSFWRDPVENVQRAVELGCEYVHVYYELCFETSIVSRAHDAGLAVDAWSIDDRETRKRLAAISVDAVTVNSHDSLQ